MKSITQRTSLCLVCLCLVATAGCHDPIKAPPAGQGDLLLAEHYPQIVATNNLADSLRFGRVIIDPSTGDRPMRVTVPVRSIYDGYPLNIQYQFEFMDGDGRLLNDSGWRFINLRPRVQQQLEANARHVEARDWRLIVRSGR